MQPEFKLLEVAASSMTSLSLKLKSAHSYLERIKGATNVPGMCTCGRPNGIPAIHHMAAEALGERPKINADDAQSTTL